MVEVGVYPVPGSPAPRTVLVFGGTFDPPQRAHFELPALARDAIGAGWLLYIPAGRSPFKRENPIASDDDRVAMLRAGLVGRERVAISTIELGERGEGERAASYTVETLERLRALASAETGFRLLIGADQAAGFHRWREPGRIIELAEPVVMLREPHESADSLIESLREHWPAAELDRWRRRVVGVPTIDVSATRARELLGDGVYASPELRGIIPAPVLDYVRAHGLYR